MSATQYSQRLMVLRRLLDATVRKQIQWREEKQPDTWYVTTLGGREISFRLLWVEATNQIGADPAAFEFTMPGMNAKFAFGTEGAELLKAILGVTFEDWKANGDPSYAISFLNEHLPD